MDCITPYNITIFNAYKHVTCSLGDIDQTNFYILWDPYNKELDDIMVADASMRDEGKFYNHFWVDKLKSAIGWVPGNCIYIRSCCMYRGRFHIKIKKQPSNIYAYEHIDENGYLRLRKFNERLGYHSELEVVDCLYNTSLNKML